MGIMKERATPASKQSHGVSESPYGGLPTTGPTEPLGWDVVNSMLLTEAIAAVNRCGDALSFARGARGRWLSVTVLCGDGNSTQRAFDMEEAEQILQHIIKVATARAK